MSSLFAYKVVSEVEEPDSNGIYRYFSCVTDRHYLQYYPQCTIKPAIENTGILCFDSLENAIKFQSQQGPSKTKTTILKVMAFNELALPPWRFVDPSEFKERDIQKLWTEKRPLPSTSMKHYKPWPEGTKAYEAVMLLCEV